MPKLNVSQADVGNMLPKSAAMTTPSMLTERNGTTLSRTDGKRSSRESTKCAVPTYRATLACRCLT